MARITILRVAASSVALLLLSGCNEWEFQGVDPISYYQQHPKKPGVETLYTSHLARFETGRTRLSAAERQALWRMLEGDASPLAVEKVVVQMHPQEPSGEAKREHLRKALRAMGIDGRVIVFEHSLIVELGQAKIDAAYASAVLPDCPDWRLSPTSSYSNGRRANIGCATATNLGMMVADPRDLEHGNGQSQPDNARGGIVIRDYRAGRDWGPSAKSNSQGAVTENTNLNAAGSDGGGGSGGASK